MFQAINVNEIYAKEDSSWPETALKTNNHNFAESSISPNFNFFRFIINPNRWYHLKIMRIMFGEKRGVTVPKLEISLAWGISPILNLHLILPHVFENAIWKKNKIFIEN